MAKAKKTAKTGKTVRKNTGKIVRKTEYIEYQNRGKFHDLADELEKEDPKKYAEVIINLRDFEYDDIESEKFSLPKSQMHDDFIALGREDIAERVMAGDFDQEPPPLSPF